MASIFPGSASVGQIFDGYLFNGTAWDLIGNEFNPTTFSPNAPDNPKAGDLWVDSDSNVPSISNETILTIASASATYATKVELSNIDALPSQSGNTGKYLTTNGSAASWSTIDLTSAINTASAAAVTYLVDSAPATLNTLNELAAALGDDANFASTVTTSLGNKLDTSTASSTYLTQASGLTQASASTTYLSKNEASSIYLTSASMQTVPVYVMNSGSSAQRPVSPTAGMFRFNTDSGYPEWYDSITNNWYNFYQGKSTTLEYLVVAGGGGGGEGGGGAGGYLISTQTLSNIGSYTITIGAGGSGSSNGASLGSDGSNSVFSIQTAIGGGRGGVTTSGNGFSGGSGGGGRRDGGGSGGAGTSGQGFAGGTTAVGGYRGGGGGGGAGGVGNPGTGGTSGGEKGGDGGIGILSTIAGVSTFYAGGGGGATEGSGGFGAGGSNVGGRGYSNSDGIQATSGQTNKGGGGGGRPAASGSGTAGAGGSGVVILSYPSYYTISIGAGLTGTTATIGENKITTFTTGTGTVTFN